MRFDFRWKDMPGPIDLPGYMVATTSFEHQTANINRVTYQKRGRLSATVLIAEGDDTDPISRLFGADEVELAKMWCERVMCENAALVARSQMHQARLDRSEIRDELKKATKALEAMYLKRGDWLAIEL